MKSLYSNIKPNGSRRFRIYLAGPEVFMKDAHSIGVTKKSLCDEYGFEGVFPFDVQIETSGITAREAGLLISRTNEELICSCHAIIANITPFRGPSADVGTAYEMGFGHALGLRVCAYSNSSISFAERTMMAMNRPSKRDEFGVLRDENDMSIEEWDMLDNLMIEGCVHNSGGTIITEDVPRHEMFSSLKGFEKCLQYLRDQKLTYSTGHCNHKVKHRFRPSST
jgi:nucleoside 2-deoxyribosyltransferase